MTSIPRVTGSQPAVSAPSASATAQKSGTATSTNPSLRAYTGTDEFAVARPTLQDVIRANPDLRTNQDLINYFYRMGRGTWEGGQKVAREYGADLNDLVKDRKGSALAYAASLQSVTETPPARAPEAAPKVVNGALDRLLDEHPEIRTNQHLINYFYAQGFNTWEGAEAVAKGFGVSLNDLVKDRSGSVRSGSPQASEAPSAAPAKAPESNSAKLSALQELLAAHPEIQSNQDLINYFFRQGGNDWARAQSAATKVGADLNELVKNRSGSAAAYAAQSAADAPATGPIKVEGQANNVTAKGTVREAYDDFARRIAAGFEIDPNYSSQISATMKRIADRMPYIDEIARQADLPRELVAAIWFRESSSMPTDVYLHNGEKLGKTTTLVPKGIYFGKDQFVEAAVHALNMKSSIKKSLGLHYGSTDFAAMAAFSEAYNGFGYRLYHDCTSAYVAAGTSLYEGGRYVADGKFDPNSWDQRPGTLALMVEMFRRYPR
ncbi:MAG: hypothetical protein ACOX6T_05385 [Myxococcales bacterium]|jgi:lysozyme family protein